MKLSVASSSDISYGGVAIVAYDHRLRDTLVFLKDKGEFPLPDDETSEHALAAAMMRKFPARWPSTDADALRGFGNASRLAIRERFIGRAIGRPALVLTQRGHDALGNIHLVRSSCGATMVRRWRDDEPSANIYCHYCGSLI